MKVYLDPAAIPMTSPPTFNGCVTSGLSCPTESGTPQKKKSFISLVGEKVVGVMVDAVVGE